jgi:hypothetical protein
MEEFIISETSKVFTKGIKRYVEKYNSDMHDVSLLLYSKSKEDVGYQVYVGGDFKEEVTIKDILGVKLMDLKGYSVIVPPYIKRILDDLCVELKSNKVDITVYLNGEGDDVRFFLYESGKLQKEVFLNELIAKSILQ